MVKDQGETCNYEKKLFRPKLTNGRQDVNDFYRTDMNQMLKLTLGYGREIKVHIQQLKWGIIPAKYVWACDVKKALISFTSEAEVGFRAKNCYHFLVLGTCLQPALTNKQTD